MFILPFLLRRALHGSECRLSCVLLFTVIALCAPRLVYAQNRPPDSIMLRTVVIQTTRAGAKNPVPHTNMSAEEIAAVYQAQDVPFLLSGVPSLVETSDAGSGVGYTGLRIRGSDPTRINVTLNGIPLNDAESQGVYWVDLPDLAASAAEIQVQRGVGTSTNGAGAFGATVNLDLSRVAPEPFVAITNTAGSFATRKHSAYLGTGLINGKLAFSGRLSNIHSDGYIDRAKADLNAIHLSGTYIDENNRSRDILLAGMKSLTRPGTACLRNMSIQRHFALLTPPAPNAPASLTTTK
jgi:iron complex outermembrane receptor protein